MREWINAQNLARLEKQLAICTVASDRAVLINLLANEHAIEAEFALPMHKKSGLP